MNSNGYSVLLSVLFVTGGVFCRREFIQGLTGLEVGVWFGLGL